MPISTGTSTINVNGVARLLVDNDLLGTASENGVSISFQYHTEDVYSDDLGPAMPMVTQAFGEEAEVTAELVCFDGGIMAEISPRFIGGTLGVDPNTNLWAGVGNAGVFQYNAIGSDQTFQLTVEANDPTGLSTDTGNYVFPKAYLVDNSEVRLGTRATRRNIRIRCLPNSSGVLFTYS